MTNSVESSPPRSSFAYDQPSETGMPNSHGSRDQVSMSPDFEFFVSGSFELESSADELFSNGMILPVQADQKTSPVPRTTPCKLPPIAPAARKEERSFRGGVGFGRAPSTPSLEEEPVSQGKSVLCSFPFLPRSNSMGSVPSTKRVQSKQPSNVMRKSRSVPPSSYGHSWWYKKNVPGRHEVRVSPVLNVPTSCICEGTARFFGLGWFRRGGKGGKKTVRR